MWGGMGGGLGCWQRASAGCSTPTTACKHLGVAVRVVVAEELGVAVAEELHDVVPALNVVSKPARGPGVGQGIAHAPPCKPCAW